jgi:hypothetical protein
VAARLVVQTQVVAEVPVQYFQSIIAIEVAVTGALLFQIRYFDRTAASDRSAHLPHPWLLVSLAIVIAATVFGSLWALLHGGATTAASAVTVGLAISILPILLRVLPPVARDAHSGARDPGFVSTIVGLLAYVVVVAGAIVLLNV